MALVTAFFIPETDKKVIAYGLQFFSDSHPSVSEDLASQLYVYYNADLIIKDFMSERKIINLEYHEGIVASNKRLVATECIDHFLCQFMITKIEGKIEPSEIKISGKQAFEIASIAKPELLEKEYIYEGEPVWFGMLGISENIPVWSLGPPITRIDARNGEVLQ